MLKMILKRGIISFAISSFAGLFINLMIDLIASACGAKSFISMPPDYVAMFPNVAIAAYVNILLYGLIGLAYSAMTFIFEINRIGFVIQYCIYFVGTSIVLSIITLLIWKLYRYPQALICTLAGYAVSFAIMGVVQYKALKADIKKINEELK